MNWEKVKLEKLCAIVRGSSPRPQGDPRYYIGPIPRLMIEDITRDGKYVTPQVDSLTLDGAKLSRPMKKGEMVITVSGKTGVPAILNVDACIHDGFVGFRELSKNLNIDYLFHYLSSLTLITSQQAVGAIFKNLTTDQLKNIEIPLPPISTQIHIAEILNAADELKRNDLMLLKKYDELAQAIFIDMFGDPVKNEKRWSVKYLNEVSIKITDGEHGTVERLKNGKPYLMARNIRDGFIDFTEVDFISENDHNRIYKRCNPEKGDLLLVCVGATIGRVCLMPSDEQYSLARSVALIKPNKKLINPTFLYSFFKTNYMQKQIQASNNSSAQSGLYTGKISNLKIIVPDIKLQNIFENRIKNILNQCHHINTNLTINLFKSLIANAFSSEIVS